MKTPKPSSRRPSTLLASALLIAVVAYAAWNERSLPTVGPAAGAPTADRQSRDPAPPDPAAAEARSTAPKQADRIAPAPGSSGLVMRQQRIHDQNGRLVHQGDIDLAPVFARIAAGERDSHRNDGAVFANREGRLPKAARGYYTEWVFRTEGLRGVGPQRIIIGASGDAYYTPDHYQTFIRVRGPS